MANSTVTNPHEALKADLCDAAHLAQEGEQRKKRAVADARAAGLKWDEICAISGVTRPTAMRYAREAGEVQA